MTTDAKTALVIVMSAITSDPRVRRQIDWLTEAGWIVDTIGPGDHHVPEVRDHFALATPASWVTTPFGSAVIYGLLPHRAKFATLTGNRIPAEAANRVSSGDYHLVVFNDHHFMPWIDNAKVFTSAAREAHIHLDLHEYITPHVPRDSLWRLFAAPYFEWIRSFISHPAFTTRSTVVGAIGRLYADELGIAEPEVIRNAPPFVDQEPRPVEDRDIRLLHHGAANPHRGLYEMIDAMRLVDERFSLTFFLVGADERIQVYKDYAKDLGDRVRFEARVPMQELPRVVNAYDAEIMFYRPRNLNLELAMPNKLFEAVQGRLALIIGESPMMAEIVREFGNGLVVSGWEPEDLAAGINSLTADRLTELKAGSHRAARTLSAETEREIFLSTVGASS
jgi:glycosyltransferase involved in cell wall biosynthesis